MGIPANQFKTIMSSIADSTKDRAEDKGFRGIGRLGGISSCTKLIFKCSAPGEDVLSMCVWDAALLKEILVDKNQHPSAIELVDRVTHYSQATCSKEDHFFVVELVEVEDASKDLLDVNKVKRYLECVAPLPYKTGFNWSEKIEQFAKEHRFAIDIYNVRLNGELLYKPYNNRFFEKSSNGNYCGYDDLEDIETRIFTSASGEVLAWMWFGVSKFKKQIPQNDRNIMRGIRLRKGNIQIGDENAFRKLYKEPRGYLYFVGEVFAVSPNLIPNARRDYFNINETCKEFEDKLWPLFYEQFYQIYHKANEYKKAWQRKVESQQAENEFQQKVNEGTFIDEKDKQQAEEKVKKKKEQAEEAQKTLNVREKKDNEDTVLRRVYSAIKKEYEASSEPETPETASVPQKSKKRYMTQGLSKYNKKEQKLVSRIYSIINDILPREQADMVISKIQEELAK